MNARGIRDVGGGHEHHSRASIEKISLELGDEPTVWFEEGLGRVYMLYEKRMYVVA